MLVAVACALSAAGGAEAQNPWADWLTRPETRPTLENPVPGGPPPTVDLDPWVGFASDPAGDSFGVAATPDITGFQSDYFYSRNTWQLTLTFDHSISPTSAGAADSIFGFIDVDLDADVSTGVTAASAIFCPPPPGGPVSSLGVEAFISIPSYDPVSGTTLMIDIGGGPDVEIPTTYGARSVTFDIPTSALQGNQKPEVLAVLGSLIEPTDCAPDEAVPLAPAGASVISVPTLDKLGLGLMILLLTVAALRLRRA